MSDVVAMFVSWPFSSHSHLHKDGTYEVKLGGARDQLVGRARMPTFDAAVLAAFAEAGPYLARYQKRRARREAAP